MIPGELDYIAGRLLQDANIDRFPTDVVKVAHHLKIRVYESKFKNTNISGMFISDGRKVPADVQPGENGTILLNISDAAGRKRFTLAHEIGHYVLKHDRPSVSTELYRGRGAPYNPKDEREANQFAARLLMPTQAFVEAVNLSLPIEHLVLAFGVSAQAVIIRAKEENVLNQLLDADSLSGLDINE